jgi:hypothetical protein
MDWQPRPPPTGKIGRCFARSGGWILQEDGDGVWQLFHDSDGTLHAGVRMMTGLGPMLPEIAMGFCDSEWIPHFKGPPDASKDPWCHPHGLTVC